MFKFGHIETIHCVTIFLGAYFYVLSESNSVFLAKIKSDSALAVHFGRMI